MSFLLDKEVQGVSRQYEQSLPSSLEYGGPRTSSIAHGVIALNEWILPPDVGYSTEVSHGAVKTLSAFNFANLAAKPPYLGQKIHHFLSLFIFGMERKRDSEIHLR